MDKLSKRYYDNLLEELKRDGIYSIWTGNERHCGDYPALISGMPGFYFPHEDERLSMFYPAIWKYHYGTHAPTKFVFISNQQIIRVSCEMQLPLF